VIKLDFDNRPYYLMEGRHRAANMWLRGKKTIPVTVIEIVDSEVKDDLRQGLLKWTTMLEDVKGKKIAPVEKVFDYLLAWLEPYAEEIHVVEYKLGELGKIRRNSNIRMKSSN